MTTQLAWEHAYAKWRKTIPQRFNLAAQVVQRGADSLLPSERPMDAVAAWLRAHPGEATPSKVIARAIGVAPKAVGSVLGGLSRKGQAKKLPNGWVAAGRKQRA